MCLDGLGQKVVQCLTFTHEKITFKPHPIKRTFLQPFCLTKQKMLHHGKFRLKHFGKGHNKLVPNIVQHTSEGVLGEPLKMIRAFIPSEFRINSERI